MYHTTGLTAEQIADLCTLIDMDTDARERLWPPILGLFNSVVVTLTYLRRNRVQAELAEAYAVSQSTISRSITGVTPLIERVLRKFVPTADDLDDLTQYIVDGSLLPCWSWASHRPGRPSSRHSLRSHPRPDPRTAPGVPPPPSLTSAHEHRGCRRCSSGGSHRPTICSVEIVLTSLSHNRRRAARGVAHDQWGLGPGRG